MTSNIVNHFETVRLTDLKLGPTLTADVNDGITEVVASMADTELSCVVVMDKTEIAGIFTEHDVRTQVARSPDRWDQTIDKFMTPHPSVVACEQSAIDALRMMNERYVRNTPIIDAAGSFVGTLTFYDLIRLASAYLKAKPDIGHELAAEHSLLYIDLTGLQPRPSVELDPTSSVTEALEAMTAAQTGLVSIVNERRAVIGEFTEHDLFTKLACQVEDLDDEVVGDWMTTMIAGTHPTTTIAEGLHLMADVGHRYLVLLNETDHALGVLTFRDIAEYFEAAFAVT